MGAATGGVRKSSFFAVLFEFFSDDKINIGSKDSWALLSCVWCVEWGEMVVLPSATSKEEIKAFLTRRSAP
jgi:predicted P-loop ATPase